MSPEIDFSRFVPERYGPDQYDYTRAIFRRLGIDPTGVPPVNFQDVAITKFLDNFFRNSGVGLDTNLGQLVHVMGLEAKIERYLGSRNVQGGRSSTVRGEAEALYKKAAAAREQLGALIFVGADVTAEVSVLSGVLFPPQPGGRTVHTTAMQRQRIEAVGAKIADIRTRFPLTSRMMV